MKQGVYGGLIIGFVCWLISSGYLIFTPAPSELKGLVIFVAFLMFILSIGIAIASAIVGHAIFGTTGDGLIYGFTIAFDILYILTQLSLGHLPLP